MKEITRRMLERELSCRHLSLMMEEREYQDLVEKREGSKRANYGLQLDDSINEVAMWMDRDRKAIKGIEELLGLGVSRITICEE